MGLQHRGKSVSTSNWVYGSLIYRDGKPFIVGNVDKFSELKTTVLRSEEVKPETVCSTDGMTDDLGNLVYKDDIIEFVHEIIASGKLVRGYEIAEVYPDSVVPNFIHYDEFKVVGNRFDNIDLYNRITQKSD